MDTRQYILDERAKGTPDAVIHENLRKMNAPEVSTPSKRGFAGEILPNVGGLSGAVAGAGLGAVVGGPPGAVVGGLLGAFGGGALGETAQQGIEENLGQRKNLSMGQIAGAGVTQTLLEAGGQVVGRGLPLGTKYVAKPLVNAARQPIVNFVSKMSGYADDVVTKAMERTPGVVAALKEGEAALDRIIGAAVKNFHELSSVYLEAAKANIAKLDKLHSLGRRGQEASRNILLREANNFVDGTARSLRSSHNIGVAADGSLLFDRVSSPSRIVAGSEKGAIQEAFTLLNNVKKDTSIKNIDAIMERMIVLQRKTPAGTATGPESKKIIGEMIESLKTFAKTSYPEFAEEIEKNFMQRIAINQGKEIFGDTAYLSPKELALISKRMLQLFNSGNLPIRQTTEAIAEQTGQDVMGAAAGTLMKQGDQISIRAQNLTRRGVIEKVFEAIPREVVQNYARTGKITGDLLQNPKLQALAKSAGLTVEALLREAITVSQDYKTE